MVNGVLSKVWSESEMDQLRKHKATTYWGKGLDRRTGKKTKSK
jgi:hypothetical protein